MKRRTLLRVASLAVIATLASASSSIEPSRHAAATKVTVFKDPNCGCCKAWIEHLKQHSFDVVAKDTSDLSEVKRAGRVPERLHSCHTAFVNGYVVEGHVPATDIQRMLAEKPKIAGIAVPGMPLGSPGMEVGGRREAYDVTAFSRDGTTQRFARH